MHVEICNVAPYRIQIAWIPVWQRLDQDLVDSRVHDGEDAQPDGQRPYNGGEE